MFTDNLNEELNLENYTFSLWNDENFADDYEELAKWGLVRPAMIALVSLFVISLIIALLFLV